MAGTPINTFGAQLVQGKAVPLMLPNPKDGKDGNNGASAWTPFLVIEEDGTARYLKITDWSGGTGTKPATGYVGVAGIGTKTNASNLNALKRVMSMTAVTNASGVATFNLAAVTPAFALAPQVVVSSIFTNVIAVQCRPKSQTVTKTTATITVEQVGIVGGVIALAVGATVTILVIET